VKTTTRDAYLSGSDLGFKFKNREIPRTVKPKEIMENMSQSRGAPSTGSNINWKRKPNPAANRRKDIRGLLMSAHLKDIKSVANIKITAAGERRRSSFKTSSKWAQEKVVYPDANWLWEGKTKILTSNGLLEYT
jgi:hypothetical protein